MTSSIKRALFVTVEFADPIFSGNGVYSRSLVKALARQGVQVDVVSAVPVEGESKTAGSVSVSEFPSDAGVSAAPISVAAIGVPQTKWKRLDRSGPWEEFASNWANVARTLASQDTSDSKYPFRRLMRRVFDPEFSNTEADAVPYDAVYVVDWSGSHALLEAAHDFGESSIKDSTVFLNFRIFATRSLCADDEEWKFYAQHETMAMLQSRVSLALCDADAKQLDENAVKILTSDGDMPLPAKAKALTCPLRREVELLGKRSKECREAVLKGSATASFHEAWSLPLPDDFVEQLRASTDQLKDLTAEDIQKAPLVFVTCCVRLDRSKNGMLFAELVESLAETGLWGKQNCGSIVLPFVCGAEADKEYAAEMKRRVRTATGNNGCLIADRFISPLDLGAIFERAVLNVHPCLYDAYGLTVCEAGAFGVSTLVQHANASPSLGATSFDLVDTEVSSTFPHSPVGVSDMLRCAHRESIAIQWPDCADPKVNFADWSQLLGNVRTIVEAGTRLRDGRQRSTDAVVRFLDHSRKAQDRSLYWTEDRCAEELLKFTVA